MTAGSPAGPERRRGSAARKSPISARALVRESEVPAARRCRSQEKPASSRAKSRVGAGISNGGRPSPFTMRPPNT